MKVGVLREYSLASVIFLFKILCVSVSLNVTAVPNSARVHYELVFAFWPFTSNS